MLQRLYFSGLLALLISVSWGQCPTQTLPYSENFDTGAGCFTIIDGGASTDTWVQAPAGGSTTTGDLDGTGYMIVDSDEAGSAAGLLFEILQSPPMDATNLTGTLLLEFDQYFNSIGGDTTTVEVYDGNNWVQIYQATTDVGSFATPDQQSIDITTYGNDSLMVRFIYSDGGNWAWHWALDNFSVDDIACFAPNSLNLNSASTTGASINFGGSADSIEVEFGASGFTQGNGCFATIPTNGTNTIAIDNSSFTGCGTSFSPNSFYDVYLRNVCTSTGNGVSSWTGPLTFSTPCNTISAPYTENFDGSNWVALASGNGPGDTLDNCWSRSSIPSSSDYNWLVRTGATPSGSTGPTGDNTTGNGNYMALEASLGTSGDSAMLLTPFVDVTSLTSPQLSFYYHNYGGQIDTVHVDVFGNGAWNRSLLKVGPMQSSSADAWVQTFLDLSPYGDSVQVRFRHESQGCCGGDASIDDVVIDNAPACPKPQFPSLVSRGSTDITMSVQGSASAYNVEWGPVGFTQGTGCLDTLTSNTLVIGNSSQLGCQMTTNACYDIYIRSDCSSGGNGTSSWIGPFTYCTSCASVNLPFSENFNNGTGCFSVVDGGNTADTWQAAPAGGLSGGFSGDLDGTGHMIADSDAAGSGAITMDENLVSPIIDASTVSGSLILEYDHFYQDIGSDSGTVEVYDGSQWNYITSYTSTVGASGSPAHEYIDISAYANANLQVRFNYNDAGSWAWFWLVDNFQVRDVACSPSTNLSLVFAGTDSIAFNWQAGTATNFIIEHGPSGFTPGSGTQFSTTSSSASINNLTPQTGYDIYVIDSCAGAYPDTLGPLTAFTACPVVSVPYVEDFNSGLSCFTVTDGGTSSDTWMPVPSGGNGNLNGDINGSDYVAVDSDGAGTGPTLVETLTSPIMDASAYVNQGALVLSFLQFYNNIGADSAYVEVFDGTQWVQIAGYHQDYGAWSAPDSQYFDVTAYANANFQVRFIYDDAGSWAWHWAIDNFRVEAFACGIASNPDTNSVSPNSAVLNWNSNGNLWNINWGPTGFRQGTQATGGNMVRGTGNNPYTLSGLNSGTCYDYYVRDTCAGVGTGPWAGPFTFCTPVTCLPPTNATATNITVSSADLSWSGSGSNFQISTGPGGLTSPQAGNISLVTGSSYTFSGLSSDSSYCYYVREICTAGDTSTWVGPICFSTPCLTFNAPFIEDFEGGTLNCWSNDTVTGGNLWTIGIGSSGGTITSAYSGAQNAVFTSTSGGPYVSKLISPIIDASNLSSTELSFYYGQEVWFGDQNTLTVYYRTSASSPWIQIWTDISDVPQWTQATVAIPSNSSTLQVAFEGSDNWGRANVVDDVRIDVIGGSCTVPSAISASNEDCESFELNWSSSTGASVIEYGPVGFSPGNGTQTGIVTPPHTVNGLNISTDYDVYIADTCFNAPNNLSSFIGPLAVSTDSTGYPVPSFTATKNVNNHLNWTFDASATTGAITGYFWDFGDGNVSAGVSVTHTYSTEGQYTVELIVEAACVDDTLTEVIDVNDIGLNELKNSDINIYPNPARSVVTIELNRQGLSDAIIEISDVSGKLMRQLSWEDQNKATQKVDVSNLAEGVYMVSVQSSAGRLTKRIVIKR